MTAGITRSEIEQVILASLPPISRTYPGRMHRLWMGAVQVAFGSAALALVTVFGYKLHLNAATIVPLYLCIVVLQGVAGGTMTSAIVTAVAGACLTYFFFVPLFSFQIHDPLDRLTLFTFLITAHVITRLVLNASKALRNNENRVAPAQSTDALWNRDYEKRSAPTTIQIVTPQETPKLENSMRGSPIPDDIVYQQVYRIVASRAFKKCIRLKSLLEFMVDATVKGETNSLKEWVIGTDVYKRGAEFDPRLDPIVRTETRRLRRKLREYFETEGREDAVVIEVPTGSYVPNFRVRRDGDLFKLPGETIGDYFVLERFDESFATVTYRVRAQTSERVFALKVVSSAALVSPGVRQALEADIAAATALQHENICRVNGCQHSGRNICIISEYFEGQGIADVVDRNPPTWEQTLEITRQLVSALAAAHRLHIVHGNLNSSTVMVTFRHASGKPVLKIIDVGMRSLAGAAAEDTPHFPPGEFNAGPIDERSDVRGAGTLLHKLLRRSVCESETNADGWRGEVPEEQRSGLDAVLARCLAARPADRYANALELEKALGLLGIKSCPRVSTTGRRPDALKSQEQVWDRRHNIPRTALGNFMARALICISAVSVACATQWMAQSNREEIRRRHGKQDIVADDNRAGRPCQS